MSESGNYVAVAIASGIAGLFIFINKLVAPKEKTFFRNRDLIQVAFKTATRLTTNGHEKFVHVEDYFSRRDFRKLSWEKSPEESMDYMSKLVGRFYAG